MFDVVPGLSEDSSARAPLVRRLSMGMCDLENRRGERLRVWIGAEKPLGREEKCGPVRRYRATIRDCM